jgi:hypothetical protein
MNEADVSKQVQQMVQFIRQEAEEKANEIAVSAEEVRFRSSFFSSFFVPPIRAKMIIGCGSLSYERESVCLLIHQFE